MSADGIDFKAPPPVHVLQLQCAVAHNSWGKLGHASLVAKLKSQVDRTFQVDSSQHYAQLWLGDHNSHETNVILSNDEHAQNTMRLRDWLDLHPEQLGVHNGKEFEKIEHLSFLLKVLSIKSPLALQVHPDKAMAPLLHEKEPDVFDPNHKPEMAIALTPFTALIGFRPLSQIIDFLSEVDEFQDAVGNEISFKLREESEGKMEGVDSDGKPHSNALKAIFLRLLKTEDVTVQRALQRLVNRIKKDERMASLPEYKAILQIDAEFPGDPGALTVFLLNVVYLEPGQAVFIDAMVPHAYISGDCIECQASSDNVLRAAFTNKRRDVDLMCAKMVFAPLATSSIMVAPETNHSPNLTTTLYPSSCKDFALAKYEIAQENLPVCITSFPVASICIITQGQGYLDWPNTDVTRGDTITVVDENSSLCNIGLNRTHDHSTNSVIKNGFHKNKSEDDIEKHLGLQVFENSSSLGKTINAINDKNNHINRKCHEQNGLLKNFSKEGGDSATKSNRGISFRAGVALFVAAGTTLKIKAHGIDGEKSNVIMYRAYTGFH